MKNFKMKKKYFVTGYQQNTRFLRLVMTACLAAAFLLPTVTLSANPTLTISQIPLTLVIPGRPQVLIAIPNSESMDGTLSGAIMTGSGALSSAVSSLYNSSSPVNYTVPANFTPPLQAANSSGLAPYTVNQGGTLYDNSASRLNVAKAAVEAILQTYIQTIDFALETYSTSSLTERNTWVYYMSPRSGKFYVYQYPDCGKSLRHQSVFWIPSGVFWHFECLCGYCPAIRRNWLSHPCNQSVHANWLIQRRPYY